MNYPSLAPGQFVPPPAAVSEQGESAVNEKEAKKKKKIKARKTQKWLVLSVIFLLAAATFFYGKWSEYQGLYTKALPQVIMLEKYQGKFKNYPFKITNPRKGDQGTMSYRLLYFEAFVIVEKDNELSVEIYEVSPEKLLKPGQSYEWKEVKEGKSQVPGEAYSCTALFMNSEGILTMHTIKFEELIENEFVPVFEKFSSDIEKLIDNE